MRMLLKAQLEAEAANQVIKDGSFDTVVQAMMEKLRPEAAYFTAEDGIPPASRLVRSWAPRGAQDLTGSDVSASRRLRLRPPARP